MVPCVVMTARRMRHVFVFCTSLGALACSESDGTTSGEAATGGGSGAGTDAGTGGRAGGTGSGGTSAGGATGGGATSGGASSGGASNGGANTGGGTAGDAGPCPRPHPLYPPLDLCTLPGPGGGAMGPYTPPELPATTRTVTVSTSGGQARSDVIAACQTAGAAVSVPDSAGHIGVLDLGNAVDCDITLGPNVVADTVYVGHLPGPTVAPAHRVRIRGGQIGNVMVDPGTTDVVFDGVTLNNAVVSPAQRNGTGILLLNDATGGFVDRFAVVNSIIRMVATLPSGAGDTDGCAYLAAGARNAFFANDNIVTAGNRNAWGFRIGGGYNFAIVDSTVRISFHKMIRMNDGLVDYVYVKSGTWMREHTLTAGGDSLNDSFAQLGDLGTDHVYIHDPVLYLLPPELVAFGAGSGPGQQGKSWEARRIAWHARSAAVVSDATLTDAANACTAGALCDYGIGTHTYEYDDNLAFPANPWRSLPDIADDDPDALPIAP